MGKYARKSLSFMDEEMEVVPIFIVVVKAFEKWSRRLEIPAFVKLSYAVEFEFLFPPFPAAAWTAAVGIVMWPAALEKEQSPKSFSYL